MLKLSEQDLVNCGSCKSRYSQIILPKTMILWRSKINTLKSHLSEVFSAEVTRIYFTRHIVFEQKYHILSDSKSIKVIIPYAADIINFTLIDFKFDQILYFRLSLIHLEIWRLERYLTPIRSMRCLLRFPFLDRIRRNSRNSIKRFSFLWVCWGFRMLKYSFQQISLYW